MALEDKFVEEDVQDLEARFDEIDAEFALASQNRKPIFDWAEDCDDWFDGYV